MSKDFDAVPSLSRHGLHVLLLWVSFFALCASIRCARGITDRVDARLTSKLFPRGNDGRTYLQPVFDWSIKLSSRLSLVSVSAFLILWALHRRDARACLVVSAAPASAVFVVEHLLKPLVDRRNAYDAFLFPSGTVTAVASVSFAAYWLCRRFHGTQVVALLLFLVPTAIVGLAVVALRWHLPSDAIGGALLAPAWVLATAAAADWTRPRTDPLDTLILGDQHDDRKPRRRTAAHRVRAARH